MLQLRLFGTPTVQLDGEPVARLSCCLVSVKLLAFLATHCARPVSRSLLATLFWPNLPEPQARQYLNTHLCRVRHRLRITPADNYLLSDRETVQLNPKSSYWLDVEEFGKVAALLTQLGQDGHHIPPEVLGRLERAIDLYHGDFLEGIYDDWCLSLRERFRDQYLTMLETLAHSYRSGQQFPASLNAARQLADEDPLREEAHFLSMQLNILMGRRAEARRHYEHYETVWRKELNLEPSARMRALACELQAEHVASDGPQPEIALEQDKQLITQLFAALELLPDSQGGQIAQQLHQLLWPQIRVYAERVSLCLQAGNSTMESQYFLNLVAQLQ